MEKKNLAKQGWEFENDTKDKTKLLKQWNQGWDCLFKTLNSLKPEDLDKIVYIRNEGHTVFRGY